MHKGCRVGISGSQGQGPILGAHGFNLRAVEFAELVSRTLAFKQVDPNFHGIIHAAAACKATASDFTAISCLVSLNKGKMEDNMETAIV